MCRQHSGDNCGAPPTKRSHLKQKEVCKSELDQVSILEPNEDICSNSSSKRIIKIRRKSNSIYKGLNKVQSPELVNNSTVHIVLKHLYNQDTVYIDTVVQKSV